MLEKWKFLLRKKKLAADRKVAFNKTLGLLDVIAIGLSCSLNGIYVMIGHSIKFETGPSIIISFLIAALSIVLSGYCFCELTTRVPSNGAAYSYMYLTFGEILAFCMGWIYVLQFIVAVSSDARALSENIDSLYHGGISNLTKSFISINLYGFSEQPDFLALFIIFVNAALLIVGIKESSKLNNAINIINVAIICVIIGFGSLKADFSNWNVTIHDLKNHSKLLDNTTSAVFGHGGFAPYGVNGVLNTVSKCIYAFVGFEAIASTSEECRDEKRNVPRAIILTVVLLCVLFVLLSAVLSLMMPYYLIDEHSPFGFAFESRYAHVSLFGINVFKVLITVSILLSIFVSIYGEMYVVTRIICTMAEDGLIFEFLERLCEKFKTPVNATLLTMLIAGPLAALLTLEELIDILSMGALVAYCVVSICVVILRYRESDENGNKQHENRNDQDCCLANVMNVEEETCQCNDRSVKRLVNACVAVAVLSMVAICILLKLMNIESPRLIYLLPVSFFLLVLIVCTVVICKQPQLVDDIGVKIKFVPVTPFLCFFINFYLILTFQSLIWLVIIFWMIIGLFIYAFYGVRHSVENQKSTKFKYHHQNSVSQCLLRAESVISSRTATTTT